jgi:hypothetical protein
MSHKVLAAHSLFAGLIVVRESVPQKANMITNPAMRGPCT